VVGDYVDNGLSSVARIVDRLAAVRRNHRVRRTVECTRVLAGHANSQTTKLYDRRGQKVLLEDMERIRYRCLSFKRHVQEASRCERESSERSLLSSIYGELTKTAVLTLSDGFVSQPSGKWTRGVERPGLQTLRPFEGRDLTAIDTDSGVRSHGI